MLSDLRPSPTQSKGHFPWFLSGMVTVYQNLLSAGHCTKHFDSKVSFNWYHLQFIDETVEAQERMQFANSYTANKRQS